MAGIGAMGDLAKVNTNIGALNTYGSLKSNTKKLQLHQERLATGKRVNRASDSPANYVITRKMQSKVNALSQAQENIGDALSAMQEADSSLAQMQDIVMEMKTLAQQAATDTMGASEREAIQFEIQQYASEINDIAEDSNWQNEKLLSGNLNWSLQVGASADDTINFSVSSSKSEAKGFSAADLGLDNLQASTAAEAGATWEKLNAAEQKILETEEEIGAVINRMQLKSDALASSETNTIAAISRIQDADIAKEQMDLAKSEILQQISLMMLGKAEEAPGAFMSLFR